MKRLAPLLLVAFLATPAMAGLSRAQLAVVSAKPPPGARLDVNLMARDISGRRRTLRELLANRTTFLSFVDYTCNTLCGTDLELLGAAIQKAQLPATEYRILAFGIDPKDSARAAIEMEHREVPKQLWESTSMLLPDKATVERATAALGFHYVYDAAADQFAHPAVVYVLRADGTVRGVLSPFALTTTDMRAVLDAAAPEPTLYDRVRLLCYAYDPATGIYSLRIVMLLRIAAMLTVFLLVTAVLALVWRERRPA